MAEPTLSLTYNDLLGEVGLFLGWGRGAANSEAAWDAQKTATIESCVRSGLRQFYFPPPVPGQESPYDWSFLKPLASLTLASAASTVNLPDDFGGVEGRVTVSTAGVGVAWWPLDTVGLGTIVERQAAYPTTTGRPCLCAVEPIKGTTASAGQRWRLRLWPRSDQAYTLQLEYYVSPDALTTNLPYVYGGTAHAETVLESCLAVAEQRVDDSAGVHTAKFAERLLASIGMDRKLKPQKLGYNRDNSDLRDRQRRGFDGRPWGASTILVNGVGY
jgi:hypothetical protein